MWRELQHKKVSTLVLKTVGDPSFCVLTDPHNFSVLLNKLLHNCLRYSVENSEVRVEVQGQSPSHWSLSLTSQSKKDPPENLQALIQAFGKNQNVLNHSGGAGLGLAVAQSITQWLGGQMSLEVENRLWQIQLTWSPGPTSA
jgi:K+-sensing histidine kinase KdpD